MNKFDFAATSTIYAILISLIVVCIGVTISILYPLQNLTPSTMGGYLIIIGALGFVVFLVGHVVVIISEALWQYVIRSR